MNNPTTTLINIKEARKLLGKDGKLLSDYQIVELIQSLTSLAEIFLLDLGSNNYNGINDDS